MQRIIFSIKIPPATLGRPAKEEIEETFFHFKEDVRRNISLVKFFIQSLRLVIFFKQVIGIFYCSIGKKLLQLFKECSV